LSPGTPQIGESGPTGAGEIVGTDLTRSIGDPGAAFIGLDKKDICEQQQSIGVCRPWSRRALPGGGRIVPVPIGNSCDNAAESPFPATSIAVGVRRATQLAANMFIDECLERSALGVPVQR
jgi:hypothetical protein